MGTELSVTGEMLRRSDGDELGAQAVQLVGEVEGFSSRALNSTDSLMRPTEAGGTPWH